MQRIYCFGIALGLLATTSSAIALAQHHQNSAPADMTSPYVEQLNSPVRGLSPQEVDDLLKGRGAGYARVAELKGYPGPRHVLDLKQELNLSSEQEREIQLAFFQMQKEAQRLGQAILEREQKLSRAFAQQVISEAELQRQTKELATLYSELRTTHLRAHLQVTPLLSTEQITKYNVLRGYITTGELSPGTSHQH